MAVGYRYTDPEYSSLNSAINKTNQKRPEQVNIEQGRRPRNNRNLFYFHLVALD